MKKLSILAVTTALVLSGCGSDSGGSGSGGSDSGDKILPPKSAVLYDLEVSPSQLNYLDHIELGQSFQVMGKYDDGSEYDITELVSWELLSGDEASIVKGKVVNAKGSSIFVVSHEGVVSEEVGLNASSAVCGASSGGTVYSAINNSERDADGTCLKLAVEEGSGILVTSAPSIAFMDAMGYELRSSEFSNTNNSYKAAKSADASGYSNVKFASMHNAGEGEGQFAAYCEDLAAKNFAGYSNWKRVERGPITSIVAKDLDSLGWPHVGFSAYSYLFQEGDGSHGRIAPSGTISGQSVSWDYLPSCQTERYEDTVKLGNLTFHRALTEAEAVAKGFTPDDTYTETGTNGPSGMVVSRFNWSNADNFCENVEMGGYSDWRLPSRDELSQLYTSTQPGNDKGMFSAFGWPQSSGYWSSTTDASSYHYRVGLLNGNVGNYDDSNHVSVSCVRAD
ncbi:DUF1566 domain-containing protein [Vibrio sp. YMD68]|uniref:Lcl C-terminal domain-containing protein n=1 Tax=Vibrio sp. YMD68 TaxID=3042300 RepID=UPI00249B72AE|nr:DUF1566 domain-containing protein [Vibrio sp. YMD68]WGW01366.1 DUF1566 domain-containing protein [Vibrio sp. YMD68]